MGDRIQDLFGTVSEPLTTHVLGYTGQKPFIGTKLLPLVSFPSLSVKLPLYGKEALRKANKPVRPLYGTPETVRISKSEMTFDLEEVSLGSMIDRREENAASLADIPWNVRAAQAEFAKQLVINDREYRIASLVRNPATYAPADVTAVAPAAKWNLRTDGKNNDVNPLELIDEDLDSKSKEIGVRPNVGWMGRDVWRAIKTNTLVKFNFFGSLNTGKVTVDMVRDWLELDELLIGSAAYIDDADVSYTVWGNDAGFVYRPTGGPNLKKQPCFGFTGIASHGNLGSPAGGEDVLGYVLEWAMNPYVLREDYVENLKAHIAMPDAGFIYTAAV